jgi:hypothetical protein
MMNLDSETSWLAVISETRGLIGSSREPDTCVWDMLSFDTFGEGRLDRSTSVTSSC